MRTCDRGRRYSHTEYPDEYPVLKLLGHRRCKGGKTEYLVRWGGRRPAAQGGGAWPDSWEGDVSSDLIDAYFALYTAVMSKKVKLDVGGPQGQPPWQLP